MPKKTSTARFSRTTSSSASRPTRVPIFDFETVVILSNISRQTARSPLLSFGSTGNRNRGASVGSVVKAHTVIESVMSKRSSCITAGRGFSAQSCPPAAVQNFAASHPNQRQRRRSLGSPLREDYWQQPGTGDALLSQKQASACQGPKSG
jgi:hypothetical protein